MLKDKKIIAIFLLSISLSSCGTNFNLLGKMFTPYETKDLHQVDIKKPLILKKQTKE